MRILNQTEDALKGLPVHFAAIGLLPSVANFRLPQELIGRIQIRVHAAAGRELPAQGKAQAGIAIQLVVPGDYIGRFPGLIQHKAGSHAIVVGGHFYVLDAPLVAAEDVTQLIGSIHVPLCCSISEIGQRQGEVGLHAPAVEIAVAQVGRSVDVAHGCRQPVVFHRLVIGARRVELCAFVVDVVGIKKHDRAHIGRGQGKLLCHFHFLLFALAFSRYSFIS